jgi:hypothetical protein
MSAALFEGLASVRITFPRAHARGYYSAAIFDGSLSGFLSNQGFSRTRIHKLIFLPKHRRLDTFATVG